MPDTVLCHGWSCFGGQKSAQIVSDAVVGMIGGLGKMMDLTI